MMITRVTRTDDDGLEIVINEIGVENIKFIIPVVYDIGNGGVIYTIVYQSIEIQGVEWWVMNKNF